MENTSSPFRRKYPMTNSDHLLNRQETRIASLSTTNRMLKEHIEFLRNQLIEQQKYLELYSELIISMEKKNERSNLKDPTKINLN